MTEIEKIAYAKTFIDKMAQGINPLDDTPIPDGDLVNNVRISRCFFFVSDVLRQICERGSVHGTRTREPKAPLSISPEVAESEIIKDDPVGISEFAARIRRVANENNMQPIKINKIVDWLILLGAIDYDTDERGRRIKIPTDKGRELGLILVRKTGSYGFYDQIRYTTEAQRFIVDNIGAIMGNWTGERETDVLKYYLAGNCSVVVRPSGTEPKIKIYLSVSAKDRAAAESTSKELIADIERRLSLK